MTNYEIEEPIGSGGMADVYRGRHRRTGARVAIKVLKSYLSEDTTLVERFRREALILAGIQEAGVVRVIDLDAEDGRYFLVMELLEGETLRQRLKRGPLPESEALAVMQSVLRSLHAVHEANIIHRDLKPANVFLCSDGRVKLMDFGIARDNNRDTITVSSGFLGTPEYMSPEQVNNQELDPRSDVYSAGFLLYEMLTGTHPFNGPVEHLLKPLPALPDHISPQVRTVVKKATTHLPPERFPSAQAMAEALVPPVRPISAQPPTPHPARPEPDSEHRHRLALLLAIPIAVLLFIAIAFSIGHAVTRRRGQEARQALEKLRQSTATAADFERYRPSIEAAHNAGLTAGYNEARHAAAERMKEEARTALVPLKEKIGRWSALSRDGQLAFQEESEPQLSAIRAQLNDAQSLGADVKDQIDECDSLTATIRVVKPEHGSVMAGSRSRSEHVVRQEPQDRPHHPETNGTKPPTTPERVVTEEILPFRRYEERSPSMPAGTKLVVQEGRTGLRRVVTVNGRVVEERVIQPPKDEVVTVGNGPSTGKP